MSHELFTTLDNGRSMDTFEKRLCDLHEAGVFTLEVRNELLDLYRLQMDGFMKAAVEGFKRHQIGQTVLAALQGHGDEAAP